MSGEVDVALRREARSAGIRVGRPVSQRAVRRRRRELYALVTVVAVGTGIALTELVSGPESASRLTGSPGATATILSALVVAFCVYCIEKEIHLRRVERLLRDERRYSADVAGRLGEFTALLDAGRAVNSALDLREVLDAVLTSTLALFEGAKGSISLVDGAEELACVSAIGNPQAIGTRTRFGEGITGDVAQRREPVIVHGRASADRFPGVVPRGGHRDSAMNVPLIHRGRLLGVLNVSAAGERRFDEDDLRLLCLFAEQATSGIVHARVHEEDGRRLDALVKLEQSKSEFIAGVSHDLRTPLTSIIGCTSMARRPDVTAEQRDELLAIAEVQSHRLATMVERLLLSAEVGQHTPTASVVTLDAVAATRAAAQTFADAGRAVVLPDPEAPVNALADPVLLTQVIGYLVDNALLHGAPPVELTVASRGGLVGVTVSDRGQGIPAAERERVFERFVRLDASRTLPGIGLGLPLARAVAGAMGAALVAEPPDAGEGARFTILLTAAVEAAAAAVFVPEQRGSAETTGAHSVAPEPAMPYPLGRPA